MLGECAMSKPDGFEPFHWDCKKNGCWSEHKRLKFEVFYGLFPRGISLTDIDGAVEVDGNFLLMEWKRGTIDKDRDKGQWLFFRNFTLVAPLCVFVVDGDAKDMTVRSVQRVFRGVYTGPDPSDLNRLRERVKAWADWATANPVIRWGRPVGGSYAQCG